jgi:membrane associated rhomboid family serine protease
VIIPLRDYNPSRSTPFVTVLLILANIAVFFFQLSLGPRAGQQFAFTFGMIPQRLTLALSGYDIDVFTAALPLFTSMFLHGGVLHILGNMWFLWVFGDNVEDRMGHLRFLVFYLICGIGAGVAHYALNPYSTLPAVGASGAISGILGAYLVLFPGARVTNLVFLVFFFFRVDLPALIILGWWFAIQFINGVGALDLRQAQGGGVAWWAHIGGFVLGLLLVKLFERRRRSH